MKKTKEISEVDPEKWKRAILVSSVIERLIDLPKRTAKDVSDAGAQLGLSQAWIYRLIKKYTTEGTVSSMVPGPPSGGKGKSRLSPDMDQLISEVIEEVYLTNQKVRPFMIVREVNIRCSRLCIDTPAPSTIRTRIRSVSSREQTKRREGWRVARDKFDPTTGQFPEAKWPFSVVQIDHSPTDIILVDEEHRLPIGRAYCTAAIDIYSRCIVGFCLSLEAPSATTVGLTINHMAMPKAPWLKMRGIDADWPMFGKPDAIHVDNGADFRSEALRRGCSEHGISMQFRPVRHPKFGGAVERLFRTLMQEVHAMPGTTFSNISDRGDYESEKLATLTLAELESILVKFITGAYHERVHTTLNQSPRVAYEKGIYGTDHTLGRGLPSTLKNPKKFLIDFLPIERRSIQRYGISLDRICYFDDVLRPYIDNNDKRKFIIRRDPRDISKVHFYCPDNEQYFEISYRNIANPSISLWELRACRQRLKDEGELLVDENKIFSTYEDMQSEISAATSKTKSARRSKERKVRWTESIQKDQVSKKAINLDRTTNSDETLEISNEKFDDIEHW